MSPVASETQPAKPSEPASRRPIRLLVFSASLRRESLNTRLALLAERVITRLGGTVDHAAMSDFACAPYDTEVLEREGLPPAPEVFRQRIEANDAFVIASPEYNASMPGLLKNTIDWTSRARPQPFNEKHALLLSASPSMVGGNRGLWALRVPLEHLGTRVYPDMFSLAQAHRAFDADGGLTDATLAQRFESTLRGFLDQVEASTHYPCAKKAWFEFLGERPDPLTEHAE